MSKRVFVKFVSDPNNDLIKTIVGLACAARAVADGHEVNVFFAAAGTRILEASYIEKLEHELDSPEPMVGPMMDASREQPSTVRLLRSKPFSVTPRGTGLSWWLTIKLHGVARLAS